jgi:hypothetical protein
MFAAKPSLRVVPALCQSHFQFIPLVTFCEVFLRNFILSGNPFLGWLSVWIFEESVRISDFDRSVAVSRFILVDCVSSRSKLERILDLRLHFEV